MSLTTEELALVEEIQDQIKKACAESKYIHLCTHIETHGGLAYVTNRAIKMMADEKIKLSAALAFIENELEGVN